MNAILAFVLRIILLLLAYTFIGLISYLIYSDLKSNGRIGAAKAIIPPIHLQFTLNDEEIKKIYTKPEIILGRDPVSDLSLSDERISLRHCKVAYYQNQWWVEDLGSTNGTYLNNLLITSNTVLMNGDSLRLGHQEIRIKMEQ